MDLNQSENIALEIERSAYEVALRQPEGQRAGTYAKAASRLLLNAIVKQVKHISAYLINHDDTQKKNAAKMRVFRWISGEHGCCHGEASSSRKPHAG